ERGQAKQSNDQLIGKIIPGTGGSGSRASKVIIRGGADACDGAIDDSPPAPCACPFAEDWIAMNTVLKAFDKALLGEHLITGEQQGQQVYASHVFIENLLKLFMGRVVDAAMLS